MSPKLDHSEFKDAEESDSGDDLGSNNVRLSDSDDDAAGNVPKQ